MERELEMATLQLRDRNCRAPGARYRIATPGNSPEFACLHRRWSPMRLGDHDDPPFDFQELPVLTAD